MATINIGSPAINRPDFSGGWFFLLLANPATQAGELITANIWMHSDPGLDAITIGIWYLVSGSTYKCRAAASLGNIPSGYSQVTGLSLAVEVGDYIAVCSPQDKGSAQVDVTTSGEAGMMRAVSPSNYNVVGQELTPSLYAGATASIQGVVELPAPPDVSTTGIYVLGEATADAKGSIDATVENCDKRGFVYGKSSQSDPGDTAPGESGYDNYVEEEGDFGTGSFELTLTNLDELTTYYFRAYAHNSYGYAYGGEIEFSNDPVASEKLVPNGAGDETNIPDGGTPNWSMCASVDSSFVDPNGGYGYFTGNYVQVLDPGAARDLYNLTRTLYRGVPVKIKYRSRTARTTYSYGNGKGSIKTHGTVYESSEYGLAYWHTGEQGWFRELVINSEVRVWRNNPFTSSAWTMEEVDDLQAGIWIENEASWDDPICDQVHIIVCWVDAEVGNAYASLRTATSARLNAEVLEDESDTEVLKPKDGIVVYFEWGETDAYGNTTADQTGKVKGDPFTADISGLNPATTYHFRAVVETSDGETFYGDDEEIPPLRGGGNVATDLVQGAYI